MVEWVTTASTQRAFGEEAAWEIGRDQTVRLGTCVRKFPGSPVDVLPGITTVPIQDIFRCFSQSAYETRGVVP